ncbi:MAG: GNAT family N-acetyltransferase [Candidatus Riflebacteria bacterium]|nr:GNAT family N-acetyltransferase [Candidatus Riflebacteria bacterium]
MTGPWAVVAGDRDDPAWREAFFAFIRDVFPGLDFAAWHRLGCWNGPYQPFSIFEDGRMVANVSATPMRLLVNGTETAGVQIGTVGTLPELRGKGLARFLMEHVLDRFDAGSALVFLFANERVLDFYPKFGFRPVSTALFRGPLPATGRAGTPPLRSRPLDLESPADRDLVSAHLGNRLPLTKMFGAIDHAFITWWHLLNVFPRHVVHFPDPGVMVVATEENGWLHVWDVVSTRRFAWKAVLASLSAGRELAGAVHHFPPDQFTFDCARILPDPETHLFVRGALPLAPLAFAFPPTAQT